MIWYPWLTPAYRQLVAQYTSERRHHALLLQSVPGCGDESLIQALGYWLMCENPQGEKTCGVCHSCHMMKAETHPDWHVVEPEKGKATIGVEAVRQLTETLYNMSQQGGSKVAWIRGAERLSEAAANALLKTLEEPPKQTYFLLSCPDSAPLLPTVRSRCLHWQLSCPDEAFGIEWLRRQGNVPSEVNVLRTALRLSNGAPPVAQAMLASGDWAARAELCKELALSFERRDLLALLPLLNQDNAEERIHWAVSLLLDVMKQQQGASAFVVNQDALEAIQRLSAIMSPLLINLTVQRWLDCRYQLMTVAGINRELLLTNMLSQTEREAA
ncbi:DNA polymerase III subunit delta' [Leminorella richardii]|uniref:DNA polymerase III subunit delta' n=1 Tax=Leminorella richardii TaxID=158841 RepID=A0A2X4V2G8_9GAMM|nr:DNA polymerase III subunit delta' [Leminorella richardii]